jgi:amino acid adenylation domain-containing protein
MLLHTPFLRRADETPERPALICQDEQLSYGALERRANTVAAHLIAKGVRPGDRVIIALPPGCDRIACVLGTLVAGAVYVPVDKDQPDLRLAKIAAQCEPAAVLMDANTSCGWAENVPRIVVGDGLPSAQRVAPAARADDDLAYIMFTSGTTGTPKGVAITHGAAWNTIADVNERWSVSAGDRALALSALTFDLSVYDVFGLLGAGGAIVIPDAAKRREPAEWLRLLRTHAVTIWNSVPALMGMMVEYLGSTVRADDTSLRLVMLSGDWIPVTLPDRVRSRFASPQIVALGGVTEASIWTTFFEVADVRPEWRSIPYGKALTNQTVVVLDSGLTPCAPGEVGEIYFGGAGLAREYWRDLERTRASFIETMAFGRLYRCGDRGRLMESGDVEFLGRIDTQVKVGGHRVELGDTEAAMLEHPSVNAAVSKVVVSETDPDDRFLAAFVVIKPGANIKVEEFRRFLSDRLPAYMVPARVEFLDSLPLTANGKIDRASLQFAALKPAQAPDADPLSRIAAETLRHPHIGASDSFFEWGAQSLTIARMIARIRDELRVELSLREVFGKPTVAGLRELIDQRGRPVADLRRVSDHRPSERASFNQEQVCFLASYFPFNRAYNFQATLRFSGDLDIGRLERAISTVIARHEMLRTTIHVGTDGYCSKVHPPYRFEIPVCDLTRSTADAQVEILRNLLDSAVNTVFDVERLPLLKILGVRRAYDEWTLIQVEHHVVHDGWSIGRLWAEIQECYVADVQARAPVLPKLPAQYQQFVQWQRERLTGAYGKEALDFYCGYLSGADFDVRISQSQPHDRGLGGHNVRQILSESAYGKVRRLARDRNVSDFAILFSVFALFLAKHGGKDDFCVGTASSARTHRELEPLVGMIVNTIPVRTKIESTRSLSAILDRMHGSLLEALTYQDIPLSMIVQRLGLTQSEGRNPIFQHCFSFHDSDIPSFDFADARGELREEQNQTAKFDINVIVIPPGPMRSSIEARVLWEFSSRQFAAEEAEHFAALYAELLDAALADPNAVLFDFDSRQSRDARHSAGAWTAVPLRPCEPATDGNAYVPILLSVFVDVLARPDLGVDDNIFECGCHSLAAIRAAALFRKKSGTSLTVRTIFENPTVRGMSHTLQAREASVEM